MTRPAPNDPGPIYLNACGKSLSAPQTQQVMADYLTCAAQTGELQADQIYQPALHAARSTAATLLGATPEQTGFGSSTSQLWSRIVSQLSTTRGRILISDFEWGDNVRFLQRLVDGTELTLEVLPTFTNGQVDLAAWQARIDDDVVALCLPLVTSLCGIVFPVADIMALDRPDRALTIIDAAQGLGRMDLTAPLSGCDVIVATTRKWARGPRQTAVFSISDTAQQALGLSVPTIEAPGMNTALQLGIGHALGELTSQGPEQIADQVRTLDHQLRSGLTKAGHSVISMGSQAPGTICLSLGETQRANMSARLGAAGITGKWLTPAAEEPLAPYPPGRALLRLAPHVYTTPDQIDRALQAIGPADRP